MTKYNPYKWYYGFPEFNMAHRFTYFNSLLDTSHNSKPEVIYIKKFLWNVAHEAALGVSSFLSDDVNNSIEMESAINFIEQAAATERQKELDVIIQYKEQLKNKLPKNKKIDDILKKLNKANLDNPKELENFYSELTECINLVRQDTEDYLNRLQALATKTSETFKNLAEKDYRFRAYGDIQSMLNNLTGMATQAQKREEDAFAGRLRTVVKNYIIDNHIEKLCTSGEDYAVIVAAVTLDIERMIQKEFEKDKTKEDIAKFSLDEMKDIVDRYSRHDYSEQTRLQKAINGDFESLQDIISAGKEILGISSLTKAEDITKRHRSVSQRLSRFNEETSIMKKLKQNKELTHLVDELQLITFSSKTKQSHGNLFEFIQVLMNDAIKVKGSPATDTMTMGSATFNIDTSQSYKEIKAYIQKMADLFTEYSQNQRENRMKDRTLEFETMNRAIRETEEQLNNLLKQLDTPIDDLFIYHESLKLYAGIETRKSKEFHGREMVILNFLDELYSVNGLAGLVLPQREAMTFLALNLSDAAVGGTVRGPLEKYFSIFAGLLMFDDVRNIALEAAHTLTYEHVKNIHLYNLNGIYVPASMLLTYTARAIDDTFQEMATGRSAKAQINTSEASETIKHWMEEYGNGRYNSWNLSDNRFKDQWPKVAEKVASGTKVRIAFLASFIDMINDLIKLE